MSKAIFLENTVNVIDYIWSSLEGKPYSASHCHFYNSKINSLDNIRNALLFFNNELKNYNKHGV
ncbi:hypothetical protein SAMN02982919_02930 [Giesbergeria anulus]|uniref:Uncharacterized protein n=1 Tax=Giesbergeria anulus TaxID=180197 RepID=A0A1H9RMQ7_9BURK|nr:hypothetical protein SAMN02982919_02930 [Giesbergeria anulus]